MEVSLHPRQEKQLRELAKREGKPMEVLAGEILEEGILAHANAKANEGGRGLEPTLTFHGSQTDLDSLIAAQGVKPVARFEDLLGDFWPEEESADQFLQAVHEWRREGSKKDKDK
jgi:hypothetical protein